MMSLISQNVLPKNHVDEVKKEDAKEPQYVEGNEETEATREHQSASFKSKKRKKENNEEGKQLEIEQEKEMKKLENFLFGSLYPPVVFGEEDEEEARDLANGGPALFFTDRFAAELVSTYEKDVEFLEESNDEEETKERKPVWVDEEEVKTTIDIMTVNRLRKLRRKR